jgi:hypothetical protein
MRIILFILILVVAALLLALGTGFIRIPMTRSAQSPKVSVNGNGVSVKGGQTPTFDIETGSVAVGTKTSNVSVPVVKVVPPGQQANTVNQAG